MCKFGKKCVLNADIFGGFFSISVLFSVFTKNGNDHFFKSYSQSFWDL